MPGFLGGGQNAQPQQPRQPFGPQLKQALVMAAPMFNAMAAGYSSGRGPYAYMDQGAAGMQAMMKQKRDEEAAAAAAAAFGGLMPGGLGGAMGGASGGAAMRGTSGGASAPITFDKNAPQYIADDAMAALGKSPMSMEGKIREGLKARGMPEHVANAFIANFKDESNLNPGINEAAPVVPGSRGGFGLAQWTGPRRKALEAFAAQTGRPVDDLDVQLDFLMQELQGPEARAGATIMSAKNAPEAAAAIVNSFLRPAEENRSRREAAYLGMDGGGASSVADPLSDPYVQRLMQVMAMPGLTPEQRSVVELQLQTRIGQLTAENPDAEEERARARRARDAEMLGLRPGTPEFNQYVVTEQLPTVSEPIKVGDVLLDPKTMQPIYDGRAPKVAPTPMTPAERQRWGIPDTDTGVYFINEKGEPEKVGGGDVTVNNSIDGGGKFEEAFARGDATTVETVYNAGLAAQRNLGRIDQLESLLATSPTGLEGAVKQFAGEWGINTEGLDAVQAATAMINSMVPEQRQPGSGPMSDADLELFKQSLPRIINQPGGNKIIVDTMRAIAQYDAEGARIVQRLRNGELTRAQAFDALQNRANPLAQAQGIAAQGATAPTTGITSSGVTWSLGE